MSEREESPGGRTGRSDCACAERLSRRGALGQMSSALLAAMAGVELLGETAAAVPVLEATGTQTGPSDHSYPLLADDGVSIDRETQVIVVRFQQRAYAFNLACPHENTALRWKAQSGRFQCPRHESQYQPDGTFVSGRATRNMDRFAVRRTGDNLIVDLSRLFRSDQQARDWAGAMVSL
jgi:Rieske Fe-S protein